MPVGEHAVQPVGLDPPGTPRRDAVAQGLGLLQIAEERRPAPKPVELIWVRAHATVVPRFGWPAGDKVLTS
jgi:hypothetical protein